jgi:predicted AAA+ superfamily ATPase
MTDTTTRLGFDACRLELIRRLSEPAPSRIQLLSGARGVGKTTILRDLKERFGKRAIYAAADSFDAMIPGFWERTWAAAVDQAITSGLTVLLADELPYVHEWWPRLKADWDRAKRKGLKLHVVAAGSSALNPGTGPEESQSLRFDRITLTHWGAAAMADVMKISAAKAAMRVVQLGSYPATFQFVRGVEPLLAYARDSIVHPALGRDVLALGAVRKPAILRHVFTTAAMHPSQIVPLQKIQRQLQERVSIETIATYLLLLRRAYLVASVEKQSTRITRQRAAPPKLVVLNNALCAAVDPRGAPDETAEPERFRAWAENACLAFALNSGQRVQYWRDEQLSVDGVIEGSWGKWAVDVRTGPFASSDIRGLIEFSRRNPSFSALVLCSPSSVTTAERAGVAAQTWMDFLNNGPKV